MVKRASCQVTLGISGNPIDFQRGSRNIHGNLDYPFVPQRRLLTSEHYFVTIRQIIAIYILNLKGPSKVCLTLEDEVFVDCGRFWHLSLIIFFVCIKNLPKIVLSS